MNHPCSSYYRIPLFLCLLFLNILVRAQDTIRILPLGNSITVGETDGSLSEDKMKGYRYGLRFLLKNAGYKLNFVGSQSSGCTYFNDCQHGGIGGIRDQYIVRLLTDGYDERNMVQILVPPRPYLDEYKPDIILLHIGTNDITHEGTAAITNQKITEILNKIDEYEIRSGKTVIVFLALIINRVKPWNPGSPAVITSQFNNAIKTMAQSRIVAGDYIVIVDMENNAGFTYSYADDMANDGQGIHPNETGYSKMAAFWYSSIISNYNTSPVISSILDQKTFEGINFSTLSLNDYVTDIENAPGEIQWSADQINGNNLNIIINNNILTVTPKLNSWIGSQTIILKATDLGRNNKFIKSDQDTVVFSVLANHPPVINSTPPTQIKVDQLYSYQITASDMDNTPISYSSVCAPAWLSFDPINHILSGHPAQSDVGPNNVTLKVSDGFLEDLQSYSIEVNNLLPISNIDYDPIVLYPNPVKDVLFINSDDIVEDSRYTIINATGKVCFNNALLEKSFPLIDVSGLENGIYILRIVNNDHEITRKFLVLR